jgi:sporulation protein YlmC with PRC-barrel domain
MTHIGLFAAGMAAAHVAGTERRVSKEQDMSRAINGVSAKRQLLGQKVYNDQGEMVGKIDDLILTKKVVTYAIVGAGGFLGLGTHDVAIPASKFLRDEDRIVLPDASKEALRSMSRFEYAQVSD